MHPKFERDADDTAPALRAPLPANDAPPANDADAHDVDDARRPTPADVLAFYDGLREARGDQYDGGREYDEGEHD